MSKEIQNFIESLKDWEKNFTIQDYDYTRYDCEVATIAKAQNEKDVNTLINFWNEKLENKYFELRHPIYNDVITRAVWSIVNYATIVFMIDRDNKYPWVFAQHYCMINNIMIPNFYLNLYNCWGDGFYNNLIQNIKYHLKNSSIDKLKFKNIPFALSNETYRPAHFFHDCVSSLLLVDQNKLKDKFMISNTFFIPLNIKTVEPNSDDFVFVRLSNCYKMPHEGIIKLNPSREIDIYQNLTNHYLQSYSTLVEYDPLKEDYTLTLWLGLPGERRAWLEQIQGTALILKHFNRYFKKIKVYVDGMTAYDGQRQDFPENKKLFHNIVNATKELFHQEECLEDSKTLVLDFETLKELESKSKEDSVDKEADSSNESAKQELQEIKSKEKFIVFKSLAGYDYRSKICYCNDCDISICEGATTTSVVPVLLIRNPGVLLYGNAKIMSSIFITHENQKIVSQEKIKTANEVNWVIYNYHIPPQHIYNLAAEVLEELSQEGKLKIKNLKMHRLEVPSVELIAKQYELEQQFKIKLSLESVKLYEELLGKITEKDSQLNTKNQELDLKTKEIQTLQSESDSKIKELESNLKASKDSIQSLNNTLNSLPIKKQTLEIKNLEQDLKIKELKTKQIEKELGYEYNVLEEIESLKQSIKTKDLELNQRDSRIKELESKSKGLELSQKDSKDSNGIKDSLYNQSAKDRIHNHLSYKLGKVMIENSKSLWGYMRMPYVLSYIKEQHNKEQKEYQERIKNNPNLKLPQLESYPDYKEALKEKECLTYKLGEALMRADKTWYKGGYVKLWFEVRKLKGEWRGKNR